MNVLTIYCCGTDYDRSNSRELIARLAADTLGTEGVDWLINAGPGSQDLLKRSTRTKFVSAAAQMGGLAMGILPQVTESVVDRAARGLGTLAGAGMDYNIADTVDLVLRVRPAKINMAGWSRGAITCLRIANELERRADFPPVPINLFLIDPVPGRFNLWNWDRLHTTVPTCVNSCSVILQEGEGRFIMEPLVQPFLEKTHGRTLFRIYPLPGPHSASVELETFAPIARLAEYLAKRFLASQGTIFKNPQQTLDSVQICECYAQIQEASRRLPQNEVLSDLRANLVTNPERRRGLFVNQDHAAEFARAYPASYEVLRDLDNPNVPSAGMQHKLKHDVQKMKRRARSTLRMVQAELLTAVLKSNVTMLRYGMKAARPRMSQREEFLISLYR